MNGIAEQLFVFWNWRLPSISWGALAIVSGKLLVTVLSSYLLYVILFRTLRTAFRRLDRDIFLVTLNVSAYPALTTFTLVCLRLTTQTTEMTAKLQWLDRLWLGAIIIAASYWALELFKEVVIYYLKDYANSTEVMWDNVLVPLLEGVVPVLIAGMGISGILQFSFGLNLTGAWLTLGGVTFVIGLAVRDILANFFSGVALLIDSPFQFGDVLRFADEDSEFGRLGILKKIGVRVTHLYMFESHTEVYIPNSLMQNQKITNLSRPIEPVFYTVPIELNPEADLESAKELMQEIIQAHPDTLGDIEIKLACLDKYYGEVIAAKKTTGRDRLLAENEVNLKLEEIEQALEALMVTLQFAEEGGLNREEIATIQEEFAEVVALVGFVFVPTVSRIARLPLPFLNLQQFEKTFWLEESNEPDCLLNLVRDWYRTWLKDPQVVDNDQFVLPEIWERKLDLLKRRVWRLYHKILHPQRIETRLDDYVKDLIFWLRDRFKQARSTWQNPEVRLNQLTHDQGFTYAQFTLNYYVDDIRLEDGERGIRIKSDIQREILIYLTDAVIFAQIPEPHLKASQSELNA